MDRPMMVGCCSPQPVSTRNASSLTNSSPSTPPTHKSCGLRLIRTCDRANATRSSALAARERGARSVVHSHALSALLAGDLAVDADHVAIRNTPREGELVEQLQVALSDPRFGGAFAILVADHGAYIWGDDVWEAKRHAEVYHFLFEAAVARRDRHKESSR